MTVEGIAAVKSARVQRSRPFERQLSRTGVGVEKVATNESQFTH
jgi:hypothetical protein